MLPANSLRQYEDIGRSFVAAWSMQCCAQNADSAIEAESRNNRNDRI
jgi:hypothetical protein